MLEDLPQFVPQKACLSCDGCCRFKEQDSCWRPKMTQNEVDLHCSKEGGFSRAIFSKELESDGHIRAVRCHGQIKCSFFHLEDNMCHVYQNRPFECRLYPFLLMKEEEGLSVGVHLSCPHVQQYWGYEEFDHYVVKLQAYFQRQDVGDFLRENISLGGDYTSYEAEIALIFPVVI